MVAYFNPFVSLFEKMTVCEMRMFKIGGTLSFGSIWDNNYNIIKLDFKM